MIKNLQDYFRLEQEIFLDTVSYKRIENLNEGLGKEFALLCQDNVKVSVPSLPAEHTIRISAS